jgi:hypothetical protein
MDEGAALDLQVAGALFPVRAGQRGHCGNPRLSGAAGAARMRATLNQRQMPFNIFDNKPTNALMRSFYQT